MKTRLIITFFVITTLIILFLAHYLFYDYIVRFLRLESRTYKNYLIAFLALMPLTFVASMIALHYSSNFLTRGLYFLSGLWQGLLVNVLVLIIFSWFLLGILKILRINPAQVPLRLIGAVGLAAAILLTLYGVYNVFNVRLKQVNISLSNLPEEWKGKKAVQISDVHLGNILMNGHLENILKKIDEVKPDIIFITGDLFDGMDGDLDIFIPNLKKLRAPLGVYYINGNHETYVGMPMVLSELEKTGIRILNDEAVDIKGVQLIGLRYPEREQKKDLTATILGIKDYAPGLPTILLYHEPVQIEAMEKLGINLMLSGHTHRGQIWPLGLITDLVYKGYDYGLYTIGQFNLYTSCGVGVWGPTMRTSGGSEVVVFNFS